MMSWRNFQKMQRAKVCLDSDCRFYASRKVKNLGTLLEEINRKWSMKVTICLHEGEIDTNLNISLFVLIAILLGNLSEMFTEQGFLFAVWLPLF